MHKDATVPHVVLDTPFRVLLLGPTGVKGRDSTFSSMQKDATVRELPIASDAIEPAITNSCFEGFGLELGV